MRRQRLGFVLVSVVTVLLAACGDGQTASESEPGGGDDRAERPTVVVTTNILGDVVESFAGEQIDVVTIMPIGADPHEFQASTRQADQMRDADAIIVNGAGFEEGLLDVVSAATGDGTPTFEAISAVDVIEFGEHDENGPDERQADPHFFADPARMARSVDAMADFLIDAVEGVDADALRSAADEYVAELEALDRDVESILASIAEDDRVLVTNHEVFGYFADRYDFEVVGTVIPGGATTDGASARALAELAALIEAKGVPAVFADTSSSSDLADTLAEEAGDVAVVALFTESLGGADSGGATYADMVRTNAQRIADALSG